VSRKSFTDSFTWSRRARTCKTQPQKVATAWPGTSWRYVYLCTAVAYRVSGEWTWNRKLFVRNEGIEVYFLSNYGCDVTCEVYSAFNFYFGINVYPMVTMYRRYADQTVELCVRVAKNQVSFSATEGTTHFALPVGSSSFQHSSKTSNRNQSDVEK